MDHVQGFHGYRTPKEGKDSLIRKLAAQAFPYLLAISLLMLLVGSAWHVHDHHHDEADACVWCLAAMVVIVLAATALPSGLSPLHRGFILPALFKSASSFLWTPKASRAPPVS